MPRFTGVLLDFDGTLIDSQDGILDCLRYALDGFGEAPRGDDELRSMIGVPLEECLRVHIGLGGDRLARGVALYRERWFAHGMHQGRLYDGVPELLGALRAAGCVLVLATAKGQRGAERGVEAHGLAPYFHAACGSMEGETDKRHVIARALAALPASARANAVMVGDRWHDGAAAAAHGVPFVAVAYGYGSADELAASEALALADSPAAIARLVLGGEPVARPHGG